jgi:retron-type reverse transcriptase
MHTYGHKEYKYLYTKMLDRDVILEAYKRLRKGKTKRKDIINIDINLDKEVDGMYQMILNTKPIEVEHPELAYHSRGHTPKIIHEHGKEREIYMPDIHEQWLHHIIMIVLEPIVISTSYKYSCGSFPGRGAHYGKKQIEKWIKSGKVRYYLKADIRHFYKNIRMDILMRELAIRIKDDWFLYIIEMCLKDFRGLPLGFYISQWFANYLLEPLDKMISREFPYYVRFVDDIVIFGTNKRKLRILLAKIRQMLGQRFRLKLKSNYQICKFDYTTKDGRRIGRCLDFMGFEFYRDKTILRESIALAISRMAGRIRKAKESGRLLYLKHIRAMLSYKGYISCTDTYDWYLSRIKPYVDFKKLRKIISKTDRRSHDETVERRKMFSPAGSAAAYC